MPPRYDVPKAAPQPLSLVQELVNTADFEHHREFLPDPASLSEWLAERGLPDGATGPDLEQTHRLREALRALLVANGGGKLARTAVTTLNEISESSGVGLRFAPDGSAGLEPSSTGVHAALGLVLGIVHGAMTDGSWTRLKACRQCAWAFYDYSKNRSATWCSMKICGNRLKTRAYRARHRTA